MRRIVFAVPARDMVHTAFAFDMAKAIAWHNWHTDDHVIPVVNYGTVICAQREELVQSAQKMGADYIFWADSDMRFPKEVIQRLLAREVDIVAANCARRKRPLSTNSNRRDPDDPDNLVRVWTEDDSAGLEEVVTTGHGIMLVDMSVYDRIERPWHATPWHGDGDDMRLIGEDTWFVAQAQRAGLKVHIDHDVSKEIGHVGTYTYDHSDARAERDGLWTWKSPDKWEGWRPLNGTE